MSDYRPYVKRNTPKKKLAPTAAQDERVLNRPADLKLAPKKPPVTVLQKYGYQGDIDQFSARLSEVTTAHREAFGYDPSPGLAFDLVRFNGPFSPGELLKNPKSKRGLNVVPFEEDPKNLRERQLAGMEEEEADAALLREYVAETRAGRSGEFLVEHGGAIADVLRRKPKLAAVFAREKYVAEMGFLASKPSGFLKEALFTTTTGAGQLIGGLALGPPTLVLAETLAVNEAVEERSVRPFASANKDLAIAVGKGMYQDIRHPLRNPGFAALSVFGLASVFAGGVARVGAASRATGAKATTKALIKKPLGGTVEVRRGEHVEHELLSENQLVNAAQRLATRRRNTKIQERMDGDLPGGLVSVIRPYWAQNAVETILDGAIRGQFASEKKMGRLSASRRRVEMAIENAPRRELEFVARATPLRMRMNRYLPPPMRRGLTVGEEKALQIHFSDLAGDDAAKLQAWKDFHESAIEQAPVLAKILGFDDAYIPAFVQEHRAQLASLKLAGKTLKSDKRSPRYLRAEALVRELEAEATNRKILEFGLSPVTAESRIAAAGEVVRTGKLIGPGPAVIEGEIRKLKGLLAAKHVDERRPHVEKYASGPVEKKIARLERDLAAAKKAERRTKVDPGSIYTQFKSRAKTKRQTKLEARLVAGPRAGQHGISAPDTRRYLPELHTEFHGNSILMGDFRIDTTNLASEAIGSVFRAGAVLREHAQLLKGATDKPTGSGFDMPIRTAKGKIPERLKTILSRVDEGELGAGETAWLSSQEHGDIIKHLFPGQKDDNGKWRFDPDEQIEGVKWVDSRSVLGLDTVPKLPDRTAMRAFQLINEPFRDLWLFARLAYGLNIPSNAGALTMQQGLFVLPNLARGMFSRKIYSDRVVTALDSLVSEGRFRSMVNKDIELALLKPGKLLAETWHKIADGWMRRAALIHEIQRQGFKGNKGFEEFLFNKEHEVKRVESSRRANKAIVEFNNQTEFEKNTLRNVIFVYPWQSRSAVWSLRTLVEHPMQSAILAELGDKGSDDLKEGIREHVSDPVQEAVSKWFDRTGFFPIGWNKDGTPKVVNPAAVNTFSTLKQWKDIGEAGFTGDVAYTSLGDLLGPGGQFLTFLATGRDEFGNELPGPDFVAAFGEMLESTPQYRAWKRGGVEAGEPGKRPLDPTDRKTLHQQRLDALKRQVLSPGWLNGWGTLISGGMTGRDVDTDAVYARFWNSLDANERHKLERGLIMDGLRVQGEFLKQPVPEGVKDAIRTADAWTWKQKQVQAGTGRDRLGERERDDALIEVLREQGKIDDEKVKDLRKRADSFGEEREHKEFQNALLYRYGGKRELTDWDAEVRQLWAFRKEIVQHRIDQLAKDGVTPKKKLTVDQETLFDLGRKFIAYKKEGVRRQALVDLAEGPAKAAAEAELRQWQDEQDKPLGVLPSPVRLAWAGQTKKDRDDHLAVIAKHGWATLSNFDKELLGRKSNYSDAWTSYFASVAEYKKTAPIGSRTLALDQKVDLAKQINREFPGFVRDWDFAHRRLYQRMQEFKPVRDSKNATEWRFIFDTADTLRKAVDNKVVTESDARAQWSDYMKLIRPWIKETQPAFDAELERYDKGKTGFLSSLFSRGNP